MLLSVHEWGPTPSSETIRFAERVLEEGPRDLRAKAVALKVIAHMRAMSGSLEEARRAMLQSKEIMLDLGFSWGFESVLDHNVVEMFGGDLREGERELREQLDTGSPVWERGEWVALGTAVLASNVCEQGRYEEAEQLARKAGELEIEHVWPRVTWRSTLGLSLARLGRIDEGLPIARESAALVAESDGLQLRAETLLRLAQVLRLAGQHDEALSVAARAIELSEAKGDVYSAGRARAFLEEAPGAAAGTPYLHG